MSNSIFTPSASRKPAFNNHQSGSSSYAKTNIQWCWVSSKQLENLSIFLEPLKNTWVRLIDNSHPDLEQEVLLLCPESDTEWVTWNPESGEEIISINQFCLVP